jgi:hypothetical protein
MEREKIINACAEIFSAFEEANTIDKELSLISFLTWITQEKFDFISGILNKSDLKLEAEHVEDVLTDGVWMPLAQTAFGLGFTLGSLLEPVDPIIEEKVESIRKIIKEHGLVPFVPRQRRAA